MNHLGNIITGPIYAHFFLLLEEGGNVIPVGNFKHAGQLRMILEEEKIERKKKQEIKKERKKKK